MTVSAETRNLDGLFEGVFVAAREVLIGHLPNIGAHVPDVRYGRIALEDMSTGEGVDIECDPNNNPLSVTVGIGKEKRRHHRELEFDREMGTVMLGYPLTENAHDVLLYKLGVGINPELGEKRQGQVAGYLALALATVEYFK